MKVDREAMEELKKKLEQYSFYHIIEIGNGLATPGIEAFVPYQQKVMEVLHGIDLQGKRVLDIGCRDGLFSFEAEKMGAAEVIGIDNNLSEGAVEVLIPHLKSKVRMYEMNVLELSKDTFGLFDVVIFAGVLYHLRYPFWSLRIVKNVLATGGVLILETAVCLHADDHAILYCPIGEDSPYEATSCTFFNEKGLKSTLCSLGLEPVSINYLDLSLNLDGKGRTTKKSRPENFWEKLKNTIYRKKNINNLIDLTRSIIVANAIGKEDDPYWDGHHKIHSSKELATAASYENAYATDDLTLYIPAVEYKGVMLKAVLKHYTNPDDPEGIYWKLHSHEMK